MRAIVFLSLLALASAKSRLAKQGSCLVDSAEAVSDLMDASMFIWASMARCKHPGEEVKCSVNIASAIQSTNSMINVILKALDKCDDLHTHHHKCGIVASTLTKNLAGLTAASGDVAQKCFPHTALPGNWNHQEPAMCVVNIKNTAKSLFKTIKAFLKIEKHCNGHHPEKCASNALKIVAGFAGVGEFLAGSLGQCSPHGFHGARCAQASEFLVQKMSKIAQDGLDMSKECGKHQPAPVPPPRPALADTSVLDTSRLYSEESTETQSAMGGSMNMLLAAFLPVTAIVSFVGGRFYANRRSNDEQAREFMSDNE